MNTMEDCLGIFEKIHAAIDDVNTLIIDHMTNPDMTYERMCQQRNVTYEYFFEELKSRLGKITKELASQSKNCGPSGILRVAARDSQTDIIKSIQSLASDPIVFELKPKLTESLHDFLKFYSENCSCKKGDMFRILARKYFKKYFPIYASDPEVQAYVFGKINFVLDNLISLTDQIVLESADGKQTVQELKDLFQQAKNLSPESVTMTGGSFDDIKQQKFERLKAYFHQFIEKADQYIAKIKAFDYNQKNTPLLNKIQSRIRLVLDQIDMTGSTDTKATLLAKLEDIQKRGSVQVAKLKKIVNEKMIPYDFESKQLIVSMERKIDELMEKILHIKNAKTPESIEYIKESINKNMLSIENKINQLIKKGNMSYSDNIQKITSMLAELRGELESLKTPDMGPYKQTAQNYKQTAQKYYEQHSADLSAIITSFEKSIEAALTEIRSHDMAGSLKIREIGERIRNQLELIKEGINEQNLDQIKGDVRTKISLLQNELRLFRSKLNRRFNGIEGLESVLDIVKSKLDQMGPAVERAREFGHSMTQSASQTIQTARDSASGVAHQVRDSASGVADQVRDPAYRQQLIANLNAELTEIKNMTIPYNERFQSEINKIYENILKDIDQIKSIQLDDQLRQKINKLVGQIDILSEKIKSVEMSKMVDREMIPSLDKIKGYLGRTKDHLMALRKEISVRLEEHLNEITIKAHSLMNYLKEVGNNLEMTNKGVSRKLKEISTAISNRVDSLPLDEKQFEKIRQDLKNMMQGAKSYVNENRRHLTTFNDKIMQEIAVFESVLEKKLDEVRAVGPTQTGGGQPDLAVPDNVRSNLSRRLSESLDYFGQFIDSMQMSDAKDYFNKVVNNIVDQFTHLYSFSVESELNHLIPDELGSLKKFFVKVISVYYENLNPVIWAQIIDQFIKDFLKELPHTPEEMFQFLSKCLLLNSGPFILKTLQMIRPVLSPELATKYNLTKLSYPLMTDKQVNLMLSKVVKDWDMYEITNKFSASVGHVVIVNHVTDRAKSFVLKLIKPMSMVQSCGEYNLLYNIYEEGTCERSFVQSIIKSNGREMDVRGEIRNIDMGLRNYTGSYYEIFGHNIDAKITTIENVRDIVDPNCWFALAVTLAPGIPLSKLVESDQLQKDTVYRANLHRCLDLLVYHFFNGIMKEGFYHGDLHAGNIFYSFEHNQITLIDFGAVGELDIFKDDEDIYNLLMIFIMSIFHNFDAIFDMMTTILNQKCTSSGEQIDTTTEEYKNFREKLKEYHVNNISLDDRQKEKSKSYMEFLNSSERIEEEKRQTQSRAADAHTITADSVYSFMEIKPPSKETVVENSNELRAYVEKTEITESGLEYIGFPSVMEQIIKFYAQSGVNIAIKFTDFYEFQKAYALLLGVLSKTGYNSARIGMAARKAIVQFSNVPFSKPGKIYDLWTKWDKQSNIYEYLRERINGEINKN